MVPRNSTISGMPGTIIYNMTPPDRFQHAVVVEMHRKLCCLHGASKRKKRVRGLTVNCTSVRMTPAFNAKEIPSPSVQFAPDEADMLDLVPRVACDSQRVTKQNNRLPSL